MSSREPVTLIFVCWRVDFVAQKRIDFVHALRVRTQGLRSAFDVLNQTLELDVPFVVVRDLSLNEVHALAATLESFGAAVRVVPGDATVASSMPARVLDEVRARARAWNNQMPYAEASRRLERELLEFRPVARDCD